MKRSSSEGLEEREKNKLMERKQRSDAKKRVLLLDGRRTTA
jgi:hypothetical protein